MKKLLSFLTLCIYLPTVIFPSVVYAGKTPVSNPLDQKQVSRPVNGALVINGMVDASTAVFINDGEVRVHGQVESDNVVVASRRSRVVVASRVKRFGNSQNYQDRIPLPAKLHARKILTILSAGDVVFQAAQTHSGLQTHIKALGKILDIPVTLISQRIQEMQGGYKGVETFIQAISVPSSHESEGAFVQESLGEQDVHGAAYKGKSLEFRAATSINFHAVFDRYMHQFEGKKKGFWKTKTISGGSTQTISKGSRFTSTGETPLKISAHDGDISLKAPQILGGQGAILWTPRGRLEILLGRNQAESSFASSSEGALWNKAVQSHERHLTFTLPTIEGPLEVNAMQTIAETLHGASPVWLDRLDRSSTEVVQRYLTESHSIEHEIHQSLGGPAAAVLSIAVCCVTAGAGASLVGPVIASLSIEGTVAAASLTAAANAAVSSLASQAAVSFISNQGDMGAVIGDLASSQALSSLATSILTASVCGGLCDAFELPAPSATEPMELGDRIQHALVNTTGQVAVEGLTGDVDLGEALITSLRSGAASVAGGALAHELGVEYKDPASSLDYFTHKILHAAIGAGMSVIADDDVISGAMGAVVGEIAAELYSDSMDEEDLTPLNPDWKEVRQRGVNLSKISAAAAAAFLNRDPHVAARTAENAVEENGFFVVAFYAVTGACAVYEAYEIYTIYQEEGAEAAIKQLALTGAVTILTGGAVKVGKVIYPSAKQAFLAFQRRSPAMTKVVESLSSGVDGATSFIRRMFNRGPPTTVSVTAESFVLDEAVGSLSTKITFAGKKGRVMFDGVEFRAVRDLSHETEAHLQKMLRKGVNPRDRSGNMLVGHHNNQLSHRHPDGFIIEIPKPKHSIHNKVQHPKGAEKGVGLSATERQDWNNVRKRFNKERARLELMKRGLLGE